LPGDISVSFEFFPPKSDGMMAQLWEVVKTLAPLDPAFVSVTYGAGGDARPHPWHGGPHHFRSAPARRRT
jgi:methylenetetrahydrofolate reductase (NADPH)